MFHRRLFKMMRDLKIRSKLFFSFGAVLFLLVSVIIIYRHTNITTIAGFTSLIDIDNAIADHASNVKTQLLECRGNEKSFLLHSDLKRLAKLETHFSVLKQEAQTIVQLAEASGNQAFVRKANAIIQNAELYAAKFKQVVKNFEDRGFDHSSGLRNTFVKSARRLAASVKAVNDKDTHILILQVRRHEKNYMIRKNQEYVKKVLALVETISRNSFISQADVKAYQKAFLALVEKDKSIAQLLKELQVVVAEIGPRVEEIVQKAHEDAAARMKDTKNKAGSLSKTANSIGIIALVVGVVLAVLISRVVTKPIHKALMFAQKMSEGDLTQTLDVHQKDEIGILAGALNRMGSSLNQMFKDVANGVSTLTSSSTELSAISQQMAQSANQSSARSSSVAVASEQMSSNMNSVAASSEQTSTNVSMVASATEEMTATVKEIAQNSAKANTIAREAVSKARSASDKVDQLGTAANEISKVTEVITEISEQTNLLALNATIEAARAGEAGKGFAVVANEIKELARQTAAATQEIKTKIGGIQDSTTLTVIEIKQITKVINDVNEIVATIATAVEEQSVTTQEIAGNVAQASQGIDQVNENMAQSATVSAEIAKDIAEVNLSGQEVSNGSKQINVSAQDLSQLAEQLNEMTARFTV